MLIKSDDAISIPPFVLLLVNKMLIGTKIRTSELRVRGAISRILPAATTTLFAMSMPIIVTTCPTFASRPRVNVSRTVKCRAQASRMRIVQINASELSLIAAGSNLPHPDKVAKGGEDAWFVRIEKKGGGEMYLADGVGGFNERGVDPGLYARVLTYEAAKAYAAQTKNPLGNAGPKKAIQVAQEKTRLPGASTMIIVALDGNILKVANLGDSGFRVVRHGKVVLASPAQEHYFNCPFQLGYAPLSEDIDSASEAQEFEFEIQPGDLVIVGSDGLFDNVFDEDIVAVANEAVAKVAGAGAFSAAMAASRALVTVARRNAEDPLCESPYAVELTKHNKSSTEAANAKGPLGLLSALASNAGSVMTGRKLGGKLDDITVIVGAIVATNAAHEDIAATERLSQEMQKEADVMKKRAAGEEAKTARSVNLRKQMDAALKDKVAQQEAATKAEAARPREFSTAIIENMDAATIRRLLEERGLPTSGKIERLRERLGNVRTDR